MADDIRTVLRSSDAAESLRMEMRIAKRFEQHNWIAERGVYYTDINTGKPREIDVYVPQVLDRPKRSKGIGGPLINLHIFCECKSLRGSNILLSQDPIPKDVRNTVMDYWVGNEDDLSHVVLEIAKQVSIENYDNIKALYDYAISRAYAYKGQAFRAPVVMPPPPVDLIARAFRETKGGKIKIDQTTDQSGISPLWSAIRSSLSIVKAATARAQSTALEYILGLDAKFHGLDDFKSNVAFFLDAELLRNTFFHPIIILNARLWHLTEDQIDEINSARLYIKNINDGQSYVDIVSDSSAEQYVDTMTSHFKKASYSSISRLWKILEELDWEPGQAKEAFGKALRAMRGGEVNEL